MRERFRCRKGFRKGRGTKDQIASIRWIIDKAREFQKIIYFCFIDYAKAFDCVDHSKLWKILRDGITKPPDLAGSSDGKASAYNAGDLNSMPGSGRSPGERNGNPLQYSCLENPMDQGACWATVHRVAKSRTQLSNLTSLHLTCLCRPGSNSSNWTWSNRLAPNRTRSTSRLSVVTLLI